VKTVVSLTALTPFGALTRDTVAVGLDPKKAWRLQDKPPVNGTRAQQRRLKQMARSGKVPA
jgi:hypothetical protein